MSVTTLCPAPRVRLAGISTALAFPSIVRPRLSDDTDRASRPAVSPVRGSVKEPVAIACHSYYRRANHGGLEFVRPVLASFGLVVASGTCTRPPIRHEDYQLILVQRGRYRCVLNGQRLELQPRDLLLIKRGDWHEETLGAPLHYLSVRFDLVGGEQSPAVDILFDENIEAEQQVIRGPNDAILELLERMRDESRQLDHLVGHVENALLLQLFCRVVRALPAERLSPIFLQRSGTQVFSARLHRVFEQHLTQNLSASAIAAKVGVSLRTLTKRCQEVTGRPPARAFMQYKTDYAAQVLRQSDVPIKALSHRLGFQNQYHFSRVFRRYIGVAPSRYRDAASADRDRAAGEREVA